MIQYIDDEKAIYRRLEQYPGIIQCYDLDSSSRWIQMKLMKHGDLRPYLVETRPDQQTQSSWVMPLARSLLRVLNRRVIVCDIRTDNILLDDDFSVKMIEFDIGAFGAVIYEIVTEQLVTELEQELLEKDRGAEEVPA